MRCAFLAIPRLLPTGTTAGAVRSAALLLAVLMPATLLAAPALPVASQQAVLGTWALHAEWPNRPTDVTLTVSETDGELSVTWEGAQGKLEGKEPAFADGVLSFVLEVEDQGRAPIELRFAGRIDGDRMAGKILLPNGREIPANGTRSS